MPTDATKRAGHSATRLLFASYHCYVDPSSGAAVSARELLAQLALKGWDVRIFCGPLLDFDRAEDVRQILADEHLVFRETTNDTDGRRYSLLSFRDGAIRSSVFVPRDAAQRAPSREDGNIFRAGVKQAVNQWRPDVLLTYGGDWLAAAILRETRQRNIATVFWLRNLAYRDPKLFELVDCTIVPSQFSRTHYRESLGIEAVAIPCIMDWERVTCDRSATQQYITFVNPQPAKGVFLFARIAEQLHRCRPDIPLLIVEGRSGVEWLQKINLDLSGLTNLHVMETTRDPRDFYRASHAVLVPSLCGETFGRVAAEAMINGIPVLASNRGALPEVLDGTGALFNVPQWYTPESRGVPTGEEVAPWIEAIIRLWDDREFYAEAGRRCRRRVEAWRPEVLLPRYEQVFEELLARR